MSHMVPAWMRTQLFWLRVVFVLTFALWVWVWLINGSVVQGEAKRRAALVGSATATYTACVASIPFTTKVNRYLHGSRELAAATSVLADATRLFVAAAVQNSHATLGIATPGDGEYTTRLKNYRRLDKQRHRIREARDQLRAAKREINTPVPFPVKTVSECAARFTDVTGDPPPPPPK